MAKLTDAQLAAQLQAEREQAERDAQELADREAAEKAAAEQAEREAAEKAAAEQAEREAAEKAAAEQAEREAAEKAARAKRDPAARDAHVAAVRLVMAAFGAALPAAANSSGHYLAPEDGPVNPAIRWDGKFRVVGSDWAGRFEGGRLVEAFRCVPPHFGGDDINIIN